MNALKLRMASAPLVAVSSALLACLLGACASTTPAPVLLSLPPAGLTQINSTAMPVVPAPAGLLVAVRRVAVPEYLVSRRVRYRADASTLAEWPNTFWAERIEIGISREFSAALRQQLPGWPLCDTDCGDQIPALTLQVELVPLDFVRSAQKLQARARISVSSTGAVPKVLQSQELAYELPASADTAQAEAQAIAALIQKVAAAAAPLIQAAKP